MANKLLNFISVFTIKTKIWQLGVSLSLTSAAALRAAADKLTPFHLTNFSNNLTTQQPTLTPAKKSNTHENLRRRTGRFALTRLQNRPGPPPPAVPFSRFPLPPLFPFSERLLWHGSSRMSTAEKLPLITFIVLI